MNEWLEKNKVAVLAGVGLLVIAAAAVFIARWQQPAPIVIEAPEATATPGALTIDVGGAVAKPDVYSLPYGSIVKDAIEAAGGTTSEADLKQVNLAQALSDHQKVYVPKVGEVPTADPAGGSDGAPVITGPININTATQAELETLPRIGPSTAAKIIEYREKNGPFARIEDIQKVPGIGPATFEQLKDLITVG